MKKDLKALVKNQKVEMVDIDRLIPYENNVKRHPPEQVGRIANAIGRYGWNGDPIVLSSDYVIVSGHGRRLAAIKLGLQEVPAIVLPPLPEEEINALRLIYNRSSESDYDTDALQREIMSIGEMGDLDDLLGGNFSGKELDFMKADLSFVDDSIFGDDLTSVADEQKKYIEDKIDELKSPPVSLVKAMGFRMIDSAYAIHVGQFIHEIEAKYGTDPETAFGEFCKHYVGAE